MPAPICALLIGAAVGCAGNASEGPNAYETVETAPHRHTDRARELHDKALAALDRGDKEKARRLLKQALGADVAFGPAHNNLGKLYYEQGDLYHAAWEFRYAVKTMPEHAAPHNNLGLVYEESDRLAKAVEEYEKARELAPDDMEIVGNLARARLRRGDRGEQTEALLRTLIDHDDRPQWVRWAQRELARLADDQAE